MSFKKHWNANNMNGGIVSERCWYGALRQLKGDEIMNVDKLKAIYEQVKEKTQEHEKYVEDATDRVAEIGGLAFHNRERDFAIQLSSQAYDQMDKSKMLNFIGELSDTGYIHVEFDYEGMKVVVCFSPEEVKK